jgi:hypothetical protein
MRGVERSRAAELLLLARAHNRMAVAQTPVLPEATAVWRYPPD